MQFCLAKLIPRCYAVKILPGVLKQSLSITRNNLNGEVIYRSVIGQMLKFNTPIFGQFQRRGYKIKKLKTRKAAAKRFIVTGRGQLKYGKAGKVR